MSETRRRTVVKSVRLTTEEYSLIEEVASRAGVNSARYMRECALSHSSVPIASVKASGVSSRAKNDVVVKHLCRIGNNLNQLVRLSHKGLSVDKPLLDKTLVSVLSTIDNIGSEE